MNGLGSQFQFAGFDEQDQCLTIGSCIRHEYTTLLEDFCDRNISDEITDKQVETAIRLHEGESLPGFPSPDTFEHLILPYLRKLSPPVMDCLGEAANSCILLDEWCSAVCVFAAAWASVFVVVGVQIQDALPPGV